jgi:uncharacterized protein YyaL (SSP411 family)
MNRLASEPSLYLRQHQANPVDWYPWGEEAFALAKAKDKPLLLSVGYSSCHWCHVMAHECFEDPELAAIQNRLFVSIKVDREDRPDVDRIYMEALQALTGSGGWPMTVFLLPDGRPFFAGTYFPKVDRPGLPGFQRLMEAVEHSYRSRRQEVEQMAAELAATLTPARPRSQQGGGSRGAVLEAATSLLVGSLDEVHGGFGGAPKFPQAPLVEFLLSRAALAGDPEALRAADLTLSKMAGGGIRDQLAGGFHRYSVDARWAVPHFEKMLYDQAQLICLYLHLWQLGKRPEALETARSTADFVLSELALPEGGFAASLDADTGKGEGLTYVWGEEELRRAAGEDSGLLSRLFRLDPLALVEDGLVLQGGTPWGEAGAPPTGGGKADEARLRQRLIELRRNRPQPTRDDKVVASWNGLTIAALAELGLATGEGRYLAAAERAGGMLRQLGAGPEGQLRHVFEGGQAHFEATLDDLAATALAALWLHQSTGDPQWFHWALQLATDAEQRHRDPEGPLWFDTAAGHDPLLTARPMGLDDGAVRSGTSLMVDLCLRLTALTGELSWARRAEEVLDALAAPTERVPAAFGGLLLDRQLLESGMVELAVVVSSAQGAAHLALLQRAHSRHWPNLAVGVGRVSASASGAAAGPPLAEGRCLLDGAPTAYVCRRFACQLPTNDLAVMEQELGRGRSGPG